MNDIAYRVISIDEMNLELFSSFNRHQVVKDCIRKVNGNWCVVEDAFIDDWTEKEYEFLVSCLKNTIVTKGLVIGAFLNGKLKGFASVESSFLGSKGEYLDLTSIHVSEEMRGCSIGKELFQRACQWAKAHGGQKLYISAHSAVESLAFYKKMGCVEAMEYNDAHVAAEPCDCQLEFVL